MAKYLKQSFVRRVEREFHMLGEITHSRMVELIEEEVIKNYLKDKENGKEIIKRTKEGTSSN
jgi:hypothetical protein